MLKTPAPYNIKFIAWNICGIGSAWVLYAVISATEQTPTRSCAFPITNAEKQKLQFGFLLCIQYPGLPYFISKSDKDHKSIHLYCGNAHQSCGQNTGDFLVRTARLAECQTHEEFTAATTFVIATRLAPALLKNLILTPELDKSLQPSKNSTYGWLCVYMDAW